MSMCKQCGEVFSTLDMEDGYCKRCISSEIKQIPKKNLHTLNTNIPLNLFELIIYVILFSWITLTTLITIAADIFDVNFYIELSLISVAGLFVLYTIIKKELWRVNYTNAMIMYGIGSLISLLFVYHTVYYTEGSSRKIIILAAVYISLFFALLYIFIIRKRHEEWMANQSVFNLGNKSNIFKDTIQSVFNLGHKSNIFKTTIQEDEKIDIPEELSKYYKLYQDGALSKKEYIEIKTKLLSRN